MELTFEEINKKQKWQVNKKQIMIHTKQRLKLDNTLVTEWLACGGRAFLRRWQVGMCPKQKDRTEADRFQKRKQSQWDPREMASGRVSGEGTGDLKTEDRVKWSHKEAE